MPQYVHEYTVAYMKLPQTTNSAGNENYTKTGRHDCFFFFFIFEGCESVRGEPLSQIKLYFIK